MNEKMIAKLESKGFGRWTKGNMDRLYINAQYLGYEPETASAAAKLHGEYISKSEARRVTGAKTYIDLKDDSLHSDGYWNDDLKNAAQALIDEAAAEIEAEEKAEADQATAENSKWYAVQETAEDAWDYGSEDFDEAVKMLEDMIAEKGHGLIAIINLDTNFCEDEIDWCDYVRDWMASLDNSVLAGVVRNADTWDDLRVEDCMIELCRRADVIVYSDEYESWEDPARLVQEKLGVDLGI